PLVGLLAGAIVLAWFAARRRYPWQGLLAPALTAIIVWGGLSWVGHALHSATDVPLPELALEDLSGETVLLTAFHGRPVVLNLWATWCPPCRREMPLLADAQAARPDLHFVFANQAEGPGTIRQYLS